MTGARAELFQAGKDLVDFLVCCGDTVVIVAADVIEPQTERLPSPVDLLPDSGRLGS